MDLSPILTSFFIHFWPLHLIRFWLIRADFQAIWVIQFRRWLQFQRRSQFCQMPPRRTVHFKTWSSCLDGVLYNRHFNPIQKRRSTSPQTTTFTIGTLSPFRNKVFYKQHLTSSRNGIQPPADAFQPSTNCILWTMDFWFSLLLGSQVNLRIKRDVLFKLKLLICNISSASFYIEIHMLTPPSLQDIPRTLLSESTTIQSMFLSLFSMRVRSPQTAPWWF